MIETYASYIEAVGTLEQRVAFWESRERHFEANRRFFNYQMLPEDYHEFFRPHNIIEPTPPSSWHRGGTRWDLMNFLNEVANGMHRPVPPAERGIEGSAILPTEQQHHEPPAGDQNQSFRRGTVDGEMVEEEPSFDFHLFSSILQQNRAAEEEEELIANGHWRVQALEDGNMAVVSDLAIESDPDSGAEDEDPVRVRADWFGSGRWPGELSTSTRGGLRRH